MSVSFITHPLILARFLLATLYHMVKYHAKKHSRYTNFKFSVLLFYMEGNQTRFVESNNSDIKKLIANAVPENTKKSTDNMFTRGSTAV